jgi:beta-glucosidase
MRKLYAPFAALAAALALASPARAQSSPAPASAAYKDPSLPVERRVEDLLSRMTVEEKIGQTLQVARDYLVKDSDIAEFGLGSILSGGGSAPRVNEPAAWADMIDSYQRQALSTRLGIPIIYGIDAVHGHNNVRGAVIFPHNIGMGAANDPKLVEEEGRITAEEMLATGARWDFAPCIAVPRDERWGRTYEGFGDLPELSGPLGAAEIRGLQAGGLGSGTAVLATAKHYAGDGGTAGGVDRGDARYPEDRFLAIHVAPYKDAIAAGAECVMVSFSSWNGQKDHGNAHLINDILRGKLGFKGFVVSDWGGVDLLPGDEGQRIAASINAGVDMIMIPDMYKRYASEMRDLVSSGDISRARLDEAARRILSAKFRLGLFERPFANRSLLPSVGSDAHRAVARRAVAESLVVLKNEGGVLPLGGGAKKILVVGSRADDIGSQCGGWTISWQGMRGKITEGTTIFQGIAAAAGPGSRVLLSKNGKAPSGFAPDLIVAVVGEDPYAEMKGDSSDLEIASQDRGIIAAAASLKAPVVAILLSGRPLIINGDLAKADAFVAAWLPGTEGAGVADLLFGRVKARGKLPRPWPASVDQLPLSEGEGKAPLFPRGFGLVP